MLLKLLNSIVGVFGYRFVLDDRPLEMADEDIRNDEGWDDLDEHLPRYRLIKIESKEK